MKIRALILGPVGCVAVLAWAEGVASAEASLNASQVHQAEPKKTQTYVKSGLITGGSKDAGDFVVENIRRAKNDGFDRVVIDLRNPANPGASALPFYQVALDAEKKKLTISVFGNPQVGFDAKRVHSALTRSPAISRVEFFPKVDSDAWIWSVTLKEQPQVEVFELSSPSRIILDLKTTAVAAARPVSKPKKTAARPVKSETSRHDSLAPQKKDDEDPYSAYEGVPDTVEE